jgi:cytochrome c-type biogenesis protein CcmE
MHTWSFVCVSLFPSCQPKEQPRQQLSTMYIFTIVTIVCFAIKIVNAHVKLYYEPARLAVRNAHSPTEDGRC